MLKNKIFKKNLKKIFDMIGMFVVELYLYIPGAGQLQETDCSERRDLLPAWEASE